MKLIRTHINKYIVLVILALLVAFPFISPNQYMLHIVIIAFFAIILTGGIHFPFIAGLWNLGQAGFYAIGAYSTALIMKNFGISFWVCLPLSGVIAAIIAIGFGYLAIRSKGIYFLILTMAFVEVIRLMILRVPFLGGFNVTSIPAPTPIIVQNLFKIEFVTKTQFYFLILLATVLILLVYYSIDRSRIGATLRSISENESLCRSIGINITAYKIFAFSFCSFFAGIAGALYATYAGIIGPTTFQMYSSVMMYIPIIIGGGGSLLGAVIGASFLSLLPEVLRFVALYQPLIYGVVLGVIIFFLPKGIVSLPGIIRSKWFRPATRTK